MTGAFVKLLLVVSAAWVTTFGTNAQAVDQGAVVSERVKKLTRAVKWNQIAVIPITFWIEPTSSGLRAYFMPEDEKSTLYVYDVDVK